MGENAAARIAQLNILDALFVAVAQRNYDAAEKNLEKTMSAVASKRKDKIRMTTASPSVIVFGSLHYDIMVHGPARPRKGETVAGESWHPKCGGKGGNQAVSAAKTGIRTVNDWRGRR